MEKEADEKRYEIVVSTYERELNRTEVLDSKANNLITVCGTLMTLFLGLGTFMLEKVSKDNPYINAVRLSLVLGLGVFTIDIFILVRAYRLLKYRFDPDPKALIDRFGNARQTELLLQVTSNLVDSTMHNREANKEKARTLTYGFHISWIAIFMLLIYGILLVAALSVQ